MVPFLKTVAKAYALRYGDLSGFCFVFPNKRSGTFFLKYLRSVTKEGSIAPEITTITDFVSNIGRCVVDNRISSLFTLYNCYCSLLTPDKRPDFDSFRIWGETVLTDFNEVGMNCSDPHALFKNLKDHREIATDYLTEDQRKIMEEYFGSQAYSENASSFWKHFNTKSSETYEGKDDKDKIPLRSKFLKLWETLWPLYKSFNQALADKGLVSSSGAYRAALANLQNGGRSYIPWEKIVFVGFNALTHVEIDIFTALRDMGNINSGLYPEDSLVDFIWDSTGPVFNRAEEAGKKMKNSASRFVSSNIRRFPEPVWAKKILAKSDTDRLPSSMKVIASPSNVMQAKLAAAEVERISGHLKEKDFSDAKVAIVMPDENILIPFLYALPEQFSDVNLTMGFPMKHTSVYTFVTRLRLTLRSSGIKKDKLLFYYPDLKLLLTHPIVRLLGGERQIENLIRQAENFHQVFVAATQIEDMVPGLATLIHVPGADDSPVKITYYIENILREVSDALVSVEDRIVKRKVDSEYIEEFRAELRPLIKSLQEYSISMSRDTVLSMIQRVVGGTRISIEGEPLRGLQVMGLLETRLLDFDIVVIPSLNERILPMKARSRTFIPNSLRAAYGLPPSNYSENLFSYYFYRLISRAREVVMLYDARAGSGLRSGGASRYVHQLEHIFSPEKLIQTEATFSLSESHPAIDPIEKSPEILNKLDEYLDNPEDQDRKGRPVMSASALNDYCKCEKFFFFKYIAGIPDHKMSSIHVDHVELGNIVHRVMERLYSHSEKREDPFIVGVNFIDELLKEDNTTILALATSAMLAEFEFLQKRNGMLPPDYEIVRDSVVRMIRGILANDRKLALDSPSGSFVVLGCEKSGIKIVQTQSGRPIRFRYAIDRVDVVNGQFRIVDYKTGALHASGRDFEEMFNSNSTSMTNFLQLMVYADIARELWPDESKKGVGMVLYKITEMSKEQVKEDVMVKPRMKDRDPETGLERERTFESDECVITKLKIAPRQYEEIIEEGPEFRESFNRYLQDKLDTIFDKSDFEPTENSLICEKCPYASFCLR